jgi:hypothetical protein
MYVVPLLWLCTATPRRRSEDPDSDTFGLLLDVAFSRASGRALRWRVMLGQAAWIGSALSRHSQSAPSFDVQRAYQDHPVPGTTPQLRIFKLRLCRLWQSVLVRRSQRAQMRLESAAREGGSGIYSARQDHRVREVSATPAAKRSS